MSVITWFKDMFKNLSSLTIILVKLFVILNVSFVLYTHFRDMSGDPTLFDYIKELTGFFVLVRVMKSAFTLDIIGAILYSAIFPLGAFFGVIEVANFLLSFISDVFKFQRNRKARLQLRSQIRETRKWDKERQAQKEADNRFYQRIKIQQQKTAEQKALNKGFVSSDV